MKDTVKDQTGISLIEILINENQNLVVSNYSYKNTDGLSMYT